MSLGNTVARGWANFTESNVPSHMGVASIGLVTAVAATTGADAQGTAPNSQLPPVEVTAKRAPAKKAAPRRRPTAPRAAPQAAVVPQPPAAPAPAAPSTQSFTPATGNTLQSGTGIGRLPGTVQDTPQVVNVIPQQQLREQNTSSVEQALRNVPGITLAIGEGGGGFNGDQFRIRGFEAKGDLYIDGLRDFGVYVRDSFATEEVSVIKGPSSGIFGSGTTGGVINLRQKTAHLGDAASVDFSFGTGPLYRTVIDVNKQISPTIAMRGVALYHDQDIADRDNVYSNRLGFLGSIAFGLNTDRTWIINYLHQSGDRAPDYGVPMVVRSGLTRGGLPVTEFGVPRSNYYGRYLDRDQGDVDILTSRFQAKVNSQLTFNNDTRLAYYTREFATSVPTCSNAAGGCADQFFAGGNPFIAFGGGNPTYLQNAWGIQNVASATMKFHTGFLRHEAVTGVDAFYQEDDRPGWSQLNKVTNATPIRNPGVTYASGYSLLRNPVNDRSGEGTEIGLFASDRIWLTPQLSILGGVRWTTFESSFSQPNAAVPVSRESKTDYWAPKASVIFEPTKMQTYYVSWATSASPVGQFVTNALNPIGNNATQNLLEENESYEAGAKFSLLGGRLGLTMAAFQIQKNNAIATDPATGNSVQTGEAQRVRGLEFGISGMVTSTWRVNAGYTHLRSEVLESTTAANIGNKVGGVPEHAVSLWTMYNLSQHLVSGPGTWTVGGGIIYQSFMFANGGNNNNLYGIPATFALDGLVSYEIQGWRFALNGYNLTDELNYDASFNNRAIPSSGRTLIFSLGKKF